MRRSTICARSPTAARSSPRRVRRSARWSSARVSSASRSPRRCARAGSTCMSSDRKRAARARAWGPRSAASSASSHESQGVVFHLGRTVGRIDGTRVTLSDGTTLDADFVVVGVGVRPAIALGGAAPVSRSTAASRSTRISQTSAPGVFAAGDVARWPDPHSGDRIRVEHWVVAERQGQVGRAEHARSARAVRCGAVLLEPALRRRDQLRRPRGEMGRRRRSTARWPRATAPSRTSAAVARLPSRPSRATCRAPERPNGPWSWRVGSAGKIAIPATDARVDGGYFPSQRDEAWPALPLDVRRDTYATLHMWMQVVGKVCLALTPLTNHFWNVAVSARPLAV